MPRGTIKPYLLIFDRSDIDAVIMYDPRNKKSWTKRELVNRELEERGRYFARKDIAMINLKKDGKHFAQYCVEPSSTGEPKWGMCKEYLTRAEMRRIREINIKCIETEKRENWPQGTLTWLDRKKQH